MSPLYNKVLVLGATSGIGEALASRLIQEGSKVIVVGRRKERLDAFVNTHGSDNATPIVFDVTNLDGIKDFAQSVTQAHPDLDCVVVNSGIQRAFDFAQPQTLDLSVLGSELTTNYTAPVHLTAAFLPHLKSLSQGHIVYVSAALGLIPFMIRTPNYNASKAALHSFILNVRSQLREADISNVRLVEVFPPAVQTELHDEKHQPDLANGGQIGMPLGQFIDRMYAGLVDGQDQFAIGPPEDLLKEDGWESQRGKLYEAMQGTLKKSLEPYLKK